MRSSTVLAVSLSNLLDATGTSPDEQILVLGAALGLALLALPADLRNEHYRSHCAALAAFLGDALDEIKENADG